MLARRIKRALYRCPSYIANPKYNILGLAS